MHRYFLHLIHIPTLTTVLLLSCLLPRDSKSDSNFIESLKKGKIFLEKQKPDSAVNQFVKAFSEGL
jgi:hypothetical protein